MRPVISGYSLDHVIGRGASGIVWSGRDGRGRTVAVKLPRGDAQDLEQAELEIERHVLRGLRHDHLVPLLDVVALPDGGTALVFELVEGASLRAMVAARGHLRPGEVVTVLTPLCQAVAALHRAGAVHGDISPGNVLVRRDGRPTLTDLGSARIFGTGAGSVTGTPGFVAPEVREGDPPSESADVFALGALAWFCLTGNGAPDTPIRLSPGTIESHVGQELHEVVGACIDPDPDLRPSADRLAAWVYSATAAEPVEVVVGGDDASALTHRLRLDAASVGEPPPQRGRWPGLRGLVHRAARRRLTPRAAVLTSCVGVLAATLVVVALIDPTPATGPGSSSEVGAPSSHAARGRAAVPDGAPIATATEDAARDPAEDPDAPRRRPGALVSVLADRRVEALVRRDSAALAQVHAPASASWQADADVIATLERGDQSYSGLAARVAQAEAVMVDAGRAVLRARVDHTAHVVVDGAGERSERAAVPGKLLDFTLVYTPRGWRIENVSVPRAT